jgi:hypothetical protein
MAGEDAQGTTEVALAIASNILRSSSLSDIVAELKLLAT